MIVVNEEVRISFKEEELIIYIVRNDKSKDKQATLLLITRATLTLIVRSVLRIRQLIANSDISLLNAESSSLILSLRNS